MTTPNEHTFHTPHHDEGCTKCGGFPSDPCEPPIPMRANEHEWMIEEIINEIEYLYCAHELPQQVLDANRKHFTTLTTKVLEDTISFIAADQGWEETGDRYREYYGLPTKYK